MQEELKSRSEDSSKERQQTGEVEVSRRQEFANCIVLIHLYLVVAVAMASSVVKRIPLIRFPSRIKMPAPPAAAGTPAASASPKLGADAKTPPTTGADAAAATSSRPIHAGVTAAARSRDASVRGK